MPAPAPKRSLLSLPVSIQRNLLEFCSTGDKGFVTILQLRLTCRKLRLLIDNSCEELQELLFSGGVIRLDPSKLQRFTESPPKNLLGITSLSLRRCFDCPGFASGWERLYKFWRGRLRSLEIDWVTFPIQDINLGRLLSTSTLRNFQCHRVSWFPPVAQLDRLSTEGFPPLHPKMRLLSVCVLSLSSREMEIFYEDILSHGRLRTLRLMPVTPDELLFLARIVFRKEEKTNFTLTLNFKRFRSSSGAPQDLHLMKVFVKNVTSSMSSISLLEVPVILVKLAFREPSSVRGFLSRVESFDITPKFQILDLHVMLDRWTTIGCNFVLNVEESEMVMTLEEKVRRVQKKDRRRCLLPRNRPAVVDRDFVASCSCR